MSHADPTPVQPPLTAEQLPDDPATLKRMILELLDSLHGSQRDNESLRQRLDALLRRLYGPRSERYDPNQPLLFADLNTTADAAPDAPSEPAPQHKTKRRCKPHGRRRLPENLPRELRHHELSEAERVCPGCGQTRVDIGVDQSEQLEYRPASLFVIKHLVHKYACRCCRPPVPSTSEQQPLQPQESASMLAQPLQTQPVPSAAPTPEPMDTPAQPAPRSQVSPEQDQGPPASTPAQRPLDPSEIVIAAAKPAMPIAKGLPGPGLLSHLIVSKFVDHLPLHRLERIYERQGLFLSRSTLCDWLGACSQLLRPLYQLMIAVVLKSRALHTDDTTVKLQDPVSHQLSTARLWAYLGDQAHPYNVFDFTLNRKRDGPQQFLAHYQGYLHADAFSGYDGLYLPDPRTATARIHEVACNAHARRKFFEARSSDAVRTHQALAYYRQLYELERQATDKDFSDTQRLQMRQDLSLPILERFRQWLQTERPQLLPKSAVAEAFGYALNNWSALVRYTEAGFLSIDNNVAEREMKRIAIGRKNWLFVGSPAGGHTAAILLSFTSTCQRLQVEPWAYLQDVLTRLPGLPIEQLSDLLPDRWQAAHQAKTATAPVSPNAVPATESAS